MSRKVRKAKLERKREEKRNHDWKEVKYTVMAEKGILGHKEFDKYCSMYEIARDKSLFTRPDQHPTREDYNKLKIAYSLTSGLFG